MFIEMGVGTWDLGLELGVRGQMLDINTCKKQGN